MGTGTRWPEAWDMLRSHPTFHWPGEVGRERNRIETKGGKQKLSPEWERP